MKMDNTLLKSIQEGLKNALLRSVVERELVKVPSHIRGIGKTTSLVEFAKFLETEHEVEVGVVLTHEIIAERHRNNGFDRVYGVGALSSNRGKWEKNMVVIDEGVDKAEIESK